MGMFHEVAIVHTEGDVNDVLFTIPPPTRSLHEGDVIRFAHPNGESVKYKVESVDYKVLEVVVNRNPLNDKLQQAQPEVRYGVSVIPPLP